MFKQLLPILLVVCCFSGCKLQSISYGFSGISLTNGEKTFSVDYFTNKTPFAPDLGSDFTEALKSYLRSRTPLNEVTDNNGDIRFEGQITGYTLRPMEIQRDEVAAKNRLTVTIQVKYTNTKNETGKDDFNQSFSHYAEIGVDENFDAVEGERLKEIMDKIIEDIYNKALVNW